MCLLQCAYIQLGTCNNWTYSAGVYHVTNISLLCTLSIVGAITLFAGIFRALEMVIPVVSDALD